MERLLRRIASDRVHGAGYLSRLAAQGLLERGRECSEEELRGFCEELVKAQPSMAPLRTLASRVMRGGLDAVPGFLKEADEAARLIVSHAAGLIGEWSVVMTHSYSQTVLDCLVAAKGIQVIATESLPGGEGRALAKKLREAGIEVEVVADDEGDATLVLVGADAVTPEGVVNKVGTAKLAGRAERFYVACSTHKLAREPHVGELYDLTPLERITGVITERGVVEPGELPFSECG